MVRREVKETFEHCAARYDRLIEKVVPHYHDQHEVMLSFIPFPKQKKIEILDLGIGTGAISRILLKKYPHSTVHGLDLSERMLNICSANLKKYRKRIALTLGEFEKIEFDGKYDLVIAALSIHHLTDASKRRFLKKLGKSVRRGGVMLIRDIVKSKSKRIEKLYHKLWCEFGRKNGLDSQAVSRNSKETDIPATLEDHLAWFREAGFRDADCVWKYNNFAIIVAYK